ncbi:hypothetical protein F2Q65_00720 [Thiohalocapsa marina]|uniref:Uncharacterized protein n=1 Tax=Thiohalocapsa marina TaxID=424902 RepID=A0A5M8FVR7_9GAMM|nr:hypothetical protein [Thiohalocapsa marina]KAA6187799.1 hypothetical protein F2Q65_00720 [Thiohalocapsa marina]
MSKSTRLSASTAFCLTATPTIADELRDIQLRRLLEPTQAELAQEDKGRIYIYEALTHQDIDRAMDEEFERIDAMMFIRVPKTDASGKVKKDPHSGKVITEDDGC